MFEKALESVKRIRLSGGIFGKTTTLLIVLCICVTAISIKIASWWFALVLILPMMALVFYALKRCLDFAESNPQAAIMEGAEFLLHERIVHGRKGEEVIAMQEATVDHVQPPIDSLEVGSADRPPTQAIGGPSTSGGGGDNG